MKCRRVEKLIPLYIEGDLAAGAADRMSSHLEWCGRCNWLADEYKESQSWLRSSGAPEFDEAALNALKTGVLRRLAETSPKPSLLSTLMQHWSRRQVFALSTAVLIILGMVGLYVYQTRAKVGVPMPQVVESKQGAETGRPDGPGLAGAEQAPRTGSDEQHHPSNGRVDRGVRYSKNARTAAHTASKARAAVERAGLGVVNMNRRFGDSPAMLRIEIQTSDPNIRIIWFAPKETESNQTKPATD